MIQCSWYSGPAHSAKLPVEGKEIKERLSSVAGKLLPGHELTLYEIRQSSRRLHPLFQVAMLEPLDLHLDVIPARSEILFGPLCILADVDLKFVQIVEQMGHFGVREEF